MAADQNSFNRILIVDDEPKVAMVLALSLERLGEGYSFDIAHSGNEAIAKLQQNSYHLLITDYSMPGMTGLDLIETAHRISPQTQIVLMTAHGTDKLHQRLKTLKLAGYLDKPFSLDQIRGIVQRAVARTQEANRIQEVNHLPVSSQVDEPPAESALSHHLQSLQHKTGAQCVLLISASGYPIEIVGRTKDLDVSGISALVAGNFMAVAELARLVGRDNSIFKSSYYEGDDYNIYAYDVNSEALLTVIFGATSKPGVVWFYTKQTAAALKPLLVQQLVQYPALSNAILRTVFLLP